MKIISKRVLVDKVTTEGKRLYHAHCTVADDTGSIILDVHDDTLPLDIDCIVALHNVTVKLVRERMRLTLGKWSNVVSTDRTIRGHVITEPNFSTVEYLNKTTDQAEEE